MRHAQAGSASSPNATGHYVAPQDLAHHLASSQAVLRNPLVLPQSNLRFGLQVKYGNFFPYVSTAIIKMATAVFKPASYINFHPFKGYFNLSFHSEANAVAAAKLQLIYKKIPLPNVCTWLPDEATLVVQFARLPSFVSPKRLRHELMEVLVIYGADPMLQFVVPHGRIAWQALAPLQ
ncbi:hypothetical protein L0F63_002177 [Massospora cicadina]|nr:hypothetical protein L0F63_002177 [Massospora cicadina]